MDNAEVIAARTLPDSVWEALPVVMIPHGTTLQASVTSLNRYIIDKVVSGLEPIREGYITKLYRDASGVLHIVDGHYRAAIYAELEQDMPARIATEANIKN